MGGWQRDIGIRGSEMWTQEASNTVADTVKGRTLMDEHRDGDNRLADGR